MAEFTAGLLDNLVQTVVKALRAAGV